jgi:outer membrane immunogenic protein
MRHCGVAIAVAVAAILAPSLAYGADLEVFKAELPTIYVQNSFLWGGVYVGGFLGGGWGTADWGAGSIVVNTPSETVTVASLPVSHVNVPISGFLGGGRVGANYQAGAWVFGFEGDFTGMVLKGRTSTTFGPVTDKLSGVTYTGTLSRMYALRTGNYVLPNEMRRLGGTESWIENY